MRVKTAEEADICGVSVDSLMQDYGISRIAVLKIDIEGSEKEVFEHCSTWIDNADSFLVEFHDRIKPDCNRRAAKRET